MRSLAGVRSEHVVAINDCGELADGAPYLVMERLHGKNLRELLKAAGPLVPARAAALISDACLGLGAVHEMGLIHRDLKPENLFVRHRDSGEEACTVLDFGIATRPGNNSTRRESLLGTLRYMAPEQIADSTRVGAWTDVYALGAVLYECVSGSPPHQADSETELMFKIMNADAAPLASKVPGLSEPLSRVVARALARDPSHRFQTVRELSLALAPFRRGGRASTSEALDSVETRPVGLARPATRSLLSSAILGGTAATSFALGWFLNTTKSPVETRDAPSATAPEAPYAVLATPPASAPSRLAAVTAPNESLTPAPSATSRPAPTAPSRKPKSEPRKADAPSSALPELDPSPYPTSP
jgi:serine/threonine-protein kinase